MAKEIRTVSKTQSNLFYFGLGSGLLLLGGIAQRTLADDYVPLAMGVSGLIFFAIGFYKLASSKIGSEERETDAAAWEKFKVKEQLKGRGVELEADRIAREKAEVQEALESIPAPIQPAATVGGLGALLGLAGGKRARAAQRTIRFLVVEDDYDDRRRVKSILETCFEGSEIVAVEHGALAVNELVKQSFDLVVTGINMPGMGGIELLTHIKRQHPKLPVVVVSALGHLKRGECLKQGAAECMVKPANKHLLDTAVRKAIGLPLETGA